MRRHDTYCSNFSCTPATLAVGLRPGARRATGLPSNRSRPVTNSAVPSGRHLLLLERFRKRLQTPTLHERLLSQCTAASVVTMGTWSLSPGNPGTKRNPLGRAVLLCSVRIHWCSIRPLNVYPLNVLDRELPLLHRSHCRPGDPQSRGAQAQGPIQPRSTAAAAWHQVPAGYNSTQRQLKQK
jgi:hypothetical protein